MKDFSCKDCTWFETSDSTCRALAPHVSNSSLRGTDGNGAIEIDARRTGFPEVRPADWCADWKPENFTANWRLRWQTQVRRDTVDYARILAQVLVAEAEISKAEP